MNNKDLSAGAEVNNSTTADNTTSAPLLPNPMLAEVLPFTHELKTWDEYMMDIATGKKPFEVRIDDRKFDEGHILILKGWNNYFAEYTGQEIRAEVTYILYGGHFGIEEGYVVMAIKVLDYNF